MPFGSIVGHRRLVSLLSRAVARDTVPPSLLFAGPRGVGKRRLALAVAEALNCLAPGSGAAIRRDARGTRAACRRIDRGDHPDVLTREHGASGSTTLKS